MARLSPTWAADHAENQAREAFARERRMNEAILAKNPCARSTEGYRRGLLAPSHFFTQGEYRAYLVKREMGRFNPNIHYPVPQRRVRGCWRG
jgi:hypothetical protein